jgi:hypothetical protein
LCTVIGTISHEYGHILVAKSLGCETQLHYASATHRNSVLINRLNQILDENYTAFENKEDFAEKLEFENGMQKLKRDAFFITLGGPLQTMLTGTIGFFLLLFRKDKIKKEGLRAFDWLAVFMALFWLREIFILVYALPSYLIGKKIRWFGGDEYKISKYLELWPGTLSLVFGVLGLIVALIVVFKFVPKHLRITFIVSGLAGGGLGYFLWMYKLGPIILP